MSRTPPDSPVFVTHSDSLEWLNCDLDVRDLWPEATGYSMALCYRSSYPVPRDIAVLWDVFGPDTPKTPSDDDLDRWTQTIDRVKRAQFIFRVPEVMEQRPHIVYRAIGAPDPEMVALAVSRHLPRDRAS